MAISDYASYDGLGLAELVKKNEVTALELVEEAISRIERHNPTLNAVVYEFYDRARDAARQLDLERAGPFAGVPFLLKDILGEMEGVPTVSASKLLQGQVSPVDSDLVARFKAAGVIPLAKTNAPEFGLVATTESALYGPCRNPWNLEHSTGGSSGGSAAAVAAGMVPLAHANDGGGSIRIPAACCGLVGMKPTRGRNPLGPLLGDILGGLVAEHVVTRTVRDSAAMLDCTAGPGVGDPYAAMPPERPYLDEVGRDPGTLRIAFGTRGLEDAAVDPECVRAVEEAARLCESLGHHVEEADPVVDASGVSEAFLRLWCAGLAFELESFAVMLGRQLSEDLVEPFTWALYQQGREVSATEYQMAMVRFQMLGRQMGAFMESHDVWICPTLGQPPVKLGVIDTSIPDAEQVFAAMLGYVPFTPIMNATGQPAVSLPLHQSDSGLPVGVHFSARLGDEGTLYALAAQLEEANPWIGRRPPIWD